MRPAIENGKLFPTASVPRPRVFWYEKLAEVRIVLLLTERSSQNQAVEASCVSVAIMPSSMAGRQGVRIRVGGEDDVLLRERAEAEVGGLAARVLDAEDGDLRPLEAAAATPATRSLRSTVWLAREVAEVHDHLGARSSG